MKASIAKYLFLIILCSFTHHTLANTCYRVTGEAWSHQYAEMILQLEPLSSCFSKPCGKTNYPVYQNGQPTQYQVQDSEKVTSVYYQQIDTANGQPVVVKSFSLSLCRNLITPCSISGPSAWCYLETFSTTFDADAQQWRWEMVGTSWQATTASPSVEINSLQFAPGSYTLRVRSSTVCQGRTYVSKWKTRTVRVLSKTGPECGFGMRLQAASGGSDRMNLVPLGAGTTDQPADSGGSDRMNLVPLGAGTTDQTTDSGGSDRMNLVPLGTATTDQTSDSGGSDRMNVLPLGSESIDQAGDDGCDWGNSGGSDRCNLGVSGGFSNQHASSSDEEGGSDRMNLAKAGGYPGTQNGYSKLFSSKNGAVNRHFNADLPADETAQFTNPHGYVLPLVFAMHDGEGEIFFQTLELAPGGSQSFRPGEAVVYYQVFAMQDFVATLGDDATPVAVFEPLTQIDSFELQLKEGRAVIIGVDAAGNRHYPLLWSQSE